MPIESHRLLTHAVSLSVILLAILTLASGCTAPPAPESSPLKPQDAPQLPARGFYMGTLPIPADGQSFEEVYRQVSGYAEFVPVWGRPSPYYLLADELSGSWGDLFVTDYIRGTGMFPLVHMSFIGGGLTLNAPPEISGATLSDPEWRAGYRDALLDVVAASRPRYLSIGNEVNRWYEAHGTDKEMDFTHYVTLYEEIYDEVKARSPGTQVFCVFAREIVSENREADLSVLGLFDPEKMDLLVFTSYPFALAEINRPADIPDDYYSQAAAYMPDKRFGFSELGWPSIEAFGGEEGQADFISQAAGRLTRDQGVDLHLFGWAWLTDLDENDANGLIRRDGTEKPGYAEWIRLSGR